MAVLWSWVYVIPLIILSTASFGVVSFVISLFDHTPARQLKVARAWARSAAAEMHSGFSTLRNVCGMTVGVRVELNEISAALQSDINRINGLWTEGLRRFGGPFLAGGPFGRGRDRLPTPRPEPVPRGLLNQYGQFHDGLPNGGCDYSTAARGEATRPRLNPRRGCSRDRGRG